MKILSISLAAVLLTTASCVSKKKYNSLNAQHQKLVSSEKSCNDQLKNALAENGDLKSQNKALASQVDYLKENSNKVLGALQDMSVISNKQAESIKQTLENISQKDVYIKNLQNAIARKDSLNLALVMNLKKNLQDINDQDINIRVDKGVVYIDISDKLLFNSGKYAVTDNAKKVLGKVATVLNTYPEIEFTVEGHTDNVPIHTDCMEDNWDLSVKRATSVVRILQKEYKMQPSRMSASGHGEYAPIATNDDADGRAVNRRTRIIILPQLDQFFKLVTKQ